MPRQHRTRRIVAGVGLFAASLVACGTGLEEHAVTFESVEPAAPPRLAGLDPSAYRFEVAAYDPDWDVADVEEADQTFSIGSDHSFLPWRIHFNHVDCESGAAVDPLQLAARSAVSYEPEFETTNAVPKTIAVDRIRADC